MLVVEIDVVEPQALQRGIACLRNVGRVATHAHKLPVGIAHVAELGRDDYFAASAAQGSGDQSLVRAGTVNVGGVEEIDAEIHGSMNRSYRFGFICAAIKVAHAHAAEAERG